MFMWFAVTEEASIYTLKASPAPQIAGSGTSPSLGRMRFGQALTMGFTTMRFFSGLKAIVGEVGYLSVRAVGAAALSLVISWRYRKGSVVVTTNRSVAYWGCILWTMP